MRVTRLPSVLILAGALASARPSLADEAPVGPEAATEMPAEAAATGGAGDELDWLVIGMEVGAVTIHDQIYTRAVIAPSFFVKKFEVQLYLPIIYQDDLFNASDWYRPAGNNEWSFGADQDDWIEVTRDLAGDLALKLKHLRYGDPGDPFFLRVGNLNTITVGHGLIMRNYANDTEFPAVRRVGLNLGMDFGVIGFEAVVDNLAAVQIVGGRFFLKQAPERIPLAIGLSGIVDLYPARYLGEESPGVEWKDLIGDPALLNVGLDLAYGLIEKEQLTVDLFADIAGMLPWYRSDGAGAFASVREGLATDTLWLDGAPRNYGWMAGALGNVGSLDYRAEYRHQTGAFLSSIFDGVYERQRGSYAVRTARFTADPAADELDSSTMGIYLEVGWAWKKIISFRIGYLWPFALDDGALKTVERDYVHVEAKLERLRSVNVAAAIAYDRYYSVPALLGGRATDGSAYAFLDANTVGKSTLWYGLNRNVDIVFVATMTLARDADGNLSFDGSLPDVTTTLSIGTELRF